MLKVNKYLLLYIDKYKRVLYCKSCNRGFLSGSVRSKAEVKNHLFAEENFPEGRRRDMSQERGRGEFYDGK